MERGDSEVEMSRQPSEEQRLRSQILDPCFDRTLALHKLWEHNNIWESNSDVSDSIYMQQKEFGKKDFVVLNIKELF